MVTIGTLATHLHCGISSGFVARLSRRINLYALRLHLMALISLWAREGPSDPGVPRATCSDLEALIQDSQARLSAIKLSSESDDLLMCSFSDMTLRTNNCLHIPRA